MKYSKSSYSEFIQIYTCISYFWIRKVDILDFKYKFSVNDKADFLT